MSGAAIIALALAGLGSPAVAPDPEPTAPIYCETTPGSALPLGTAVFADIVTAYEEKVGWKPWIETTSPTTFMIGFSPNARASDNEIALFEAEAHRDGLVVKSITYRIDGEIERISLGVVCLRLTGLLG
jgi:hypothetical protein